METRRVGSSKIMTSVAPGVIAMKFTDGWSAFDRGTSPQTIPDLGVARCACAVKSFALAKSVGCETHFIEQAVDDVIHVMEFTVPGHETLSGKSHGRVLPLEWIERTLAFGSLLRRFESGEVTPQELGFKFGAKVEKGTQLPRPVRECTTKFEPMDRHLTHAEAMNLARLDDEQYDMAWGVVMKAADITTARYAMAGFDRPDGKKEVAITFDGTFVLVDIFGTQDEDRIIDKKTGNLHCKDLIREHLIEVGYKKILDEAKKKYPDNKEKWPPYPLLPPEVVELVRTRYLEVPPRYSGV